MELCLGDCLSPPHTPWLFARITHWLKPKPKPIMMSGRSRGTPRARHGGSYILLLSNLVWARVVRIMSCCVYRACVGFEALSSARVLPSLYQIWPLFGLCPQPVSSTCVLPSVNDAVKHAPGRSFFLFCYRPGACFLPFLAFGPYLGSVLWPLFGLCPQLASSACVLCASLGHSGFCLGSVLSLCPQLLKCRPFWVALSLIWAVSSA